MARSQSGRPPRRSPAGTLRPTARRTENPRARAARRPSPAASGLGKACTYLPGHWAPLTAHLNYSNTALDTNTVENAIRPSAIGKRNWLFIGHPDAGDRTAVMYSLIVSRQRRGHNPHDYLKDVLTRLPAMTTRDDLRPPLPSQWKNPAAPAVTDLTPATPAPTVLSPRNAQHYVVALRANYDAIS